MLLVVVWLPSAVLAGVCVRPFPVDDVVASLRSRILLPLAALVTPDGDTVCDSSQDGPRCSGLGPAGDAPVVSGLLCRKLLFETGVHKASIRHSVAAHLSSMLSLLNLNEVPKRRSSGAFQRDVWVGGNSIGDIGMRSTGRSVVFGDNITITSLRLKGKGRLLVRGSSGGEVLWSAQRLGRSVSKEEEEDLMLDAVSLASPVVGRADVHAIDKLEFFGGGADELVELRAVTRGPGFESHGLQNLFVVLDPWNERSVVWRGRLASTAPYVDYNTVIKEGLKWAPTPTTTADRPRLFTATLLDRAMTYCGNRSISVDLWEEVIDRIAEGSRRYYKSFDEVVDALVSSYTGRGAEQLLDFLVESDWTAVGGCEVGVMEGNRRMLWRLRDDFEGLSGLEEPLSSDWSGMKTSGVGKRPLVRYVDVDDVTTAVEEMLMEILSSDG